MRSKQRESLPDIGVRKGNRSVRASNFDLSSSANDFDNTTTNNDRSLGKVAAKSKTVASTVAANKTEHKPADDKVMELLKMDSVQQENYKYVNVPGLRRCLV